MKGLLIVGKKPAGDSSGYGNGNPEEEEDEGCSLEFQEMFTAMMDSLGVKPKDPDAAMRRMKSLLNIWHYQQM